MLESTPFQLPEAIALLRRTPDALEALLLGLPEVWIRATEGEGTWSPYDVVGHLLHVERNDWMMRVRHVLEHGEARPLPVLDRTAQFQASGGREIEELLRAFAEARKKSLSELEALQLTQADFSRRGVHPKLGAVTLGNLLATWTVHDLNHLHQISRTISTQYREAVGPWVQFLGVMHCNGHGV